MPRFIQVKVDVQDPGRQATFTHGDPAALRPGIRRTGNVFILGLPGSGRSALTQGLALALGRDRVDLEDAERGGDPASGLTALCAPGKRVFRVPAALLRDPGAAGILRDSGTVLYLNAMVESLVSAAARTSPEGLEETRSGLARDFAELEPLLLGAAHFIVRADQEPGEIVQDALDKVHLAER